MWPGMLAGQSLSILIAGLPGSCPAPQFSNVAFYEHWSRMCDRVAFLILIMLTGFSGWHSLDSQSNFITCIKKKAEVYFTISNKQEHKTAAIVTVAFAHSFCPRAAYYSCPISDGQNKIEVLVNISSS